MSGAGASRGRDGVQRRTVRVLVGSQVLGGVGVASGIAVGGLLAEQVSGSTSLAGLAQTATVLGAALFAVPLARLAQRAGRRSALSAGYAAACSGAVLVVVAALAGSFALLLPALLLFGGGTAAGLQARYAATDHAAPARRARALAVVVWATTVGAVAGPNLAGLGGDVAGRVGVPRLSGPFLFSVLAFAAAAVLVLAALRGGPDPASGAPAEHHGAAGDDGAGPGTAGPGAAGHGEPATPADPAASGDPSAPAAVAARPGPQPQPSTLQTLRAVAAVPAALLGLVTIATAHAVMVAVMVMTPVHLGHVGVTLEVVGVVISAHIAGMYAASPLMGWIADAAGRLPAIGVGVALLGLALVLGMTGAGSPLLVGIALTVLGLGWSCCLVAGSALLSESAPTPVRTSVQGVGDLTMGVCAAVAGAAAGPVLAVVGYPLLSACAALLLAPVLVLLARGRARTVPV